MSRSGPAHLEPVQDAAQRPGRETARRSPSLTTAPAGPLIDEARAPVGADASGMMVGAADDLFEREADLVADALLAGRSVSVTADAAAAPITRTSQDDLSGAFDPGASFADGFTALSGGAPLPEPHRTVFERGLGIGLGAVRIHTSARAEQLSRSIGARAFTLGSDIVMPPAEFRPGTPAGDRLLAHEVAHVAQQSRGARRRIRTIRRYLYQDIVDQFAAGDLIYGLSWARSDTQAPVKAKMRALDLTGGNKQQAASVLDELNNFFVGTSGYNTDDPAAYGVAYGTQKGAAPDPAVQAQALRFKAWLESDPHFGPLFTGLQPVRGKALTDKHRTWERIKQVCLAGLKHTVTAGRKIYFILDDLNMNDVVQELNYVKDMTVPFDAKKKNHDPTGDAKEDITPNELRFIYHNWTDVAFSGNVTFWRRGKAVAAPWVDQPALWQKYADAQAGAPDDAPGQKAVPAAPATKMAELDAIRTDVLGNFATKNFEYGTKAAVRLGISLEETTGLSRGGLIKQIMGLKDLDRLREEAKQLDPALAGDALKTELARLAAAAQTASDAAGSTKFMDARLAMTRKVAFYLWRRAPAADVDEGLVFQAQEGVTGKSKRSDSPIALVVMGPDPVDRAAAIPLLDKNMKPYVHAEASRFASLLPSAQQRGSADAADLTRGADVARASAARAAAKHRNFVFEGSGEAVGEFGDLLDRVRATDYRVLFVFAFGKVNPADDAACDKLEKAARNFQSLYTLANSSYIVQGGIVEWRQGNGQPYAKIRDKLKGAKLGDAPAVTSDDPNFETAAVRFESRLGAFAFSHPTANAVAKELADKVIAYMTKRGELHKQYLDAAKDAATLIPDEAWKSIGSANTRIAGAVGTEVKAVQAALGSGNLRERLTHIYNFFESVLGRDVLDGTKTDDIKTIMRVAGLDQGRISTRAAALVGKEKLADAMPATSNVKIRDETRAKSGKSGASDRPAKEAPGLSDREKSFQGIKADNDALQWNEGVKAWLIDEQSSWSKLHRGLAVPIAAGPSGHTNSFMQIGEYLNVNKPNDIRLAVIGHLLPIRAHTLVEILDAAKPYGATYTRGRGMYRDIAPLTLKELTDSVAEGGKFPDELARTPR